MTSLGKLWGTASRSGSEAFNRTITYPKPNQLTPPAASTQTANQRDEMLRVVGEVAKQFKAGVQIADESSVGICVRLSVRNGGTYPTLPQNTSLPSLFQHLRHQFLTRFPSADLQEFEYRNIGGVNPNDGVACVWIRIVYRGRNPFVNPQLNLRQRTYDNRSGTDD